MIKPPAKRKRRVKSKKTKLMERADALVGQINRAENDSCEVCGGPNEAGHHFHAKGGCALLRFDMDNIIPLCHSCHFRHHAGDAMIHSFIVRNRNHRFWEEDLEEKIRIDAELIREGIVQKRNIGYYEETIKRLESRLGG